MAEPKRTDEQEELSVTMLGDMASALQIASHQRKSAGEETCDVSELVEEAVSDWLHKEIYGTVPETPAAKPVTQEPEVSKPEAVAPKDATAAEVMVPSAGRRLAPFIALGVILAGFIGWGLLRDSGTVSEASLTPAVVAATPVPTGYLVIDAQPWAKVDQIQNSAGEGVPLPEDPYSPLRLELPTGTYKVTLLHPDSPQSRLCEAQVTDAGTVRCQPEPGDPEILDLFKETGWWQ